jgi:hypothetical protein
MLSPEDQIRAVLSHNVSRWVRDRLPAGRSLQDVRFRDVITVDEDDVLDHVRREGFDEYVVVTGENARTADGRLCIVPEPDGRWCVYYTERGRQRDEVTVPTYADGEREVVRRLIRSARIDLNARYRSAHPDENLPLPLEM